MRTDIFLDIVAEWNFSYPIQLLVAYLTNNLYYPYVPSIHGTEVTNRSRGSDSPQSFLVHLAIKSYTLDNSG